MRIGIFSPYLKTMTGGERYILTMAVCLSKDHDVVLFWNKKDEKQLKKEAKRRFNLDIDSLKFSDNIFSREFSLWSRLKESRRYDLIIFLSDGSLPVVLTKLIIHFQMPVEWVQSNILKSKFKLTRISKIICNSKFTKNYIDKKFGVNSEILYPPVDVPSGLGLSKKENVILNVGRLDINKDGISYKKQDFLLNVYKKMYKEKATDWKLNLVVSVSDERAIELTNLKKQSEGYPIKIIVNPNSSVLWDEFAKAKVYWHASGYGEDLKLNPHRAEHFGISVVEAMGKGVVPVVINAGGLPEIVTDSKNGFLWQTEDELISKTLKIIKNNKLWQDLSTQSVIDSASFSANIFCSRLSSLIQ